MRFPGTDPLISVILGLLHAPDQAPVQSKSPRKMTHRRLSSSITLSEHVTHILEPKLVELRNCILENVEKSFGDQFRSTQHFERCYKILNYKESLFPYHYFLFFSFFGLFLWIFMQHIRG